jgi:hypothetical protein
LAPAQNRYSQWLQFCGINRYRSNVLKLRTDARILVLFLSGADVARGLVRRLFRTSPESGHLERSDFGV